MTKTPFLTALILLLAASGSHAQTRVHGTFPGHGPRPQPVAAPAPVEPALSASKPKSWRAEDYPASDQTPPPTPPPPSTGPKPDVTIAVTGGMVGGTSLDDDTYAFKGIPFARPPVGALRWTPPQPPEPWKGVRYATESASACLQVSYGWNADLAQSSSEDCLYLEIRSSVLDPAAKMPVMVFIHGGANRAGGGAGTISSALVTRDVVLVSIQYRLGVFGFLSHPALTAESPDHASGNYALMDQIAALQWVRDNIAKFGGDPDNVTLFGHSAGAQDVGLLMSSPLARGLFHKAIEESGPPQFGLPPRTLAENEAMGVDLAGQYSKSAPDSARALADLRRAPAAELQAAADRLKVPVDDASFIWLQAVVDGHVLPRSPYEVFRSLDQAPVPLIIGVSAQELGLYGGKAAVYPTAQKAFGSKFLRALGVYGLDVKKTAKDDPVMGDVAMQMSTDLMMRCPSDWTAWHVNAARQSAWLYQLDVDATGNTVHHGSELAFVFNGRPRGKTAAEWPPLLDYWANFAWDGHPNGRGVPDWPAYGREGNYIEFTREGAVAKAAMRLRVCELRDTP
ncbi:carboxylesterase/lipase family protein [Asticcacaulis solisilvae]|uniref:carboxylesterase/lipase family protein n=1 Tax=Asticcacaulis solisilvae TaxID=1217274 RepID=UPI003FD74F0E